MAEGSQELTFGRFLKFWRGVHSISQEELAHRLDSSPRHISRLENGSSRPSETMIEDIASALSLKQRDRNHLRISAGYSPKQEKVDFHASELKWLRKAMNLSLKAMDPYPSALLDSSSNILMVNRAWVGFYQATIPAAELQSVSNHYDFLFSRKGAGTLLTGWQDTLSMIVMSMQQTTLLSNDPEDQRLLDAFMANPNVPEDWAQRAAKLEPMASFRVQAEFQGRLEKFYSVNQTIGALGPAAYISEPKLTLSTLYPEDETLDMSFIVSEELTHPLLNY
ncbi:MAG: transcriptional regulator [Cellvibrionaceae bacterium]|nr:transcriptional regulator [Cellvibrionaceae bacterium]|tara:strand:- start:21625 stop:22461 length:837 start_codon:yes stop_codon:yes gene_type:complete